MKKLRNILLTMLFLLSVLTIWAFADMGPKPSVNLEIRGLDVETCYVTLLAATDSTGPYSVYDSDYGASEGDNPGVYWKFVDYQDADGYHFLQYYQEVEIKTDGRGEKFGEFLWNYYPPERFKVAIYLPETDEMLVGQEIIETYAFDSHYEVNVSGNIVTAERTYGWGWEIFAFLVRIGMTLGVELVIAKLFAFRGKGMLVILGTNVVTQLGLNVAFYLTGYTSVFFIYVIAYGIWELLVFLVEALVYNSVICRIYPDEWENMHPVRYAFWANLCSFLLGYFVSQLFPFVF